MDSSVSVNPTIIPHDQPLRVWLPQVVLLCYLVIVLATCAVTPLLAANWMRTPSVGIFVGPGMY